MKYKHIEINIGNACNMKCLFCMSIYNNDLEKIVDPELIFRSIIINRNRGYDSIGFIGGEPTIHPYFLKFVSLAKKVGYKNITVVTNGLRFSNYDFFENFIRSGGNNIKLSFHSYDNNSGYLITGVPNAFKIKRRTLDNYYYFKKKYNNLTLEVQTVINKINYKSLYKIIDLLKNYNVSIKLQYIGYYKEYPFKNLKKVFIDLDKVVIELYSLFLHYKEFFKKNYITVSDIPICYLKKYFSINDILAFLGGRYDYIEDIDDLRNKEFFNFKKRKRNKIKYYPLDKCKNCKYFNLCPGFYKGYFEILEKIKRN